MEVPLQSHDMMVQMRYTWKKHHIPACEMTSKADVRSGGRWNENCRPKEHKGRGGGIIQSSEVGKLESISKLLTWRSLP